MHATILDEAIFRLFRILKAQSNVKLFLSEKNFMTPPIKPSHLSSQKNDHMRLYNQITLFFFLVGIGTFTFETRCKIQFGKLVSNYPRDYYLFLR